MLKLMFANRDRDSFPRKDCTIAVLRLCLVQGSATFLVILDDKILTTWLTAKIYIYQLALGWA